MIHRTIFTLLSVLTIATSNHHGHPRSHEKTHVWRVALPKPAGYATLYEDGSARLVTLSSSKRLEQVLYETLMYRHLRKNSSIVIDELPDMQNAQRSNMSSPVRDILAAKVAQLSCRPPWIQDTRPRFDHGMTTRFAVTKNKSCRSTRTTDARGGVQFMQISRLDGHSEYILVSMISYRNKAVRLIPSCALTKLTNR